MNTESMRLAWPLAFLCLVSCSYEPVDHGTAKEPGFIEAYFDEHTLRDLMEEKECAVLHFYAIRRSESDLSGSVMAMPATMERELYSYWFGPWYEAYEDLDGSRSETRGLSEEEAIDAMDYLVDDGYSRYAVLFTKDEIEGVLRTEKCNGVRLIPELMGDGSRDWTMRMIPVLISDGAATALGDEDDTAVCTEPCPTYCGHMGYLPIEE